MKIIVTQRNKIAEGLNADIYGNMPLLDEQKELPYIEIKYRCTNCKGIMLKRFAIDVVIIEADLEKSIQCLYCKLKVEPEKYN